MGIPLYILGICPNSFLNVILSYYPYYCTSTKVVFLQSESNLTLQTQLADIHLIRIET